MRSWRDGIARRVALALGAAVVCATASRAAADLNEFKIKRETTFEFAEKPAFARDGDKTTITFATKSACDVSVAIEDGADRIVRHLASGVLGANAPAPFQKDSLSQRIVWDGKNDKGEYVGDVSKLTLRVSLGLTPRFERTLFWSPKKRAADGVRGVSFAAAPEGVYVFDGGQAVDHLRLFDHQGNYVRTVYPFPADKLKDVKGLIRNKFIQDGADLPVKPTYQMCTLLTIGTNAYNICFKDGKYFYGNMDQYHKGENGYASEDVAVAGTRIALGANRLGRLATDGSSGGLPVIGPSIDLRSNSPKGFYKATESAMAQNLGGYETLTNLRPHRFALSPDGKTVYFTRYIENYALDMYKHNYWHHGVFRMDYEGDQEPAPFLGGAEPGSDDTHFKMPCDIACDAKGRVYVADYGNGRVQVYEPSGKLYKSIPVEGPVQLSVSPKDGSIYVFTWPMLANRSIEPIKLKQPNVVRKFKSADDPKLLETLALPIAETYGQFEQHAEVDVWADEPTFWLSPGKTFFAKKGDETIYQKRAIMLFVAKDGQLEPAVNFEVDVKEAVAQVEPPDRNRQRLYWNPKQELLYVGEGGFHFQETTVINPATGKTQVIKLPFDSEDMGFDADGVAYLRTTTTLAKFDPITWREVPWDYGEDREKVTNNSSSGRREAHVMSAILLPANSHWHHGGLSVSPRGNMVVGCLNLVDPKERQPGGKEPADTGKPFTPKLYPGRIVTAAYGVEYLHVWDKHGRVLYEDAVPGLGTLNGVGIDNSDNLYVLSAAPRMHGDQPHYNFLAGTIMKFQPGKAKIVSDQKDRVPIPLGAEARPKRSPDLTGLPGNAWVDGAEWFYGGVGWHGKNHGLGCGCRNARFALDYYGRTFAPETDRYSVAVLDTAGNLILRIGTYGNVEDGKPLVPAGGPAVTRSIGGDEVSLMHGSYVAAQTDRRLFIADIGNYRIVSVKLDYAATEKKPLK